MFGSDFIVVKDNRGCEAGFFWSDVQQIIGVYDEARTSWSDDHQVIGTHKEVDERVKVKFRRDADEAYTLIFVMPVKEFLEQAKKQLNHPPAPSYVTPGQVTITPLSNPDPNEPLKGIETT